MPPLNPPPTNTEAEDDEVPVCLPCGNVYGEFDTDCLPKEQLTRWRTFNTSRKDPQKKKASGKECYCCWDVRRNDLACKGLSVDDLVEKMKK